VIIMLRSPFTRVEPPPLDPDTERLLLEPRPATPRKVFSRQQWWLTWFLAASLVLLVFVWVLHSVGVLGRGTSAQPAARSSRAPSSAAALPAVEPPAPSPTTPAAAATTPARAAVFAPPSPVPVAVDPAIGFTTAQCLWWKQYDKTEFATRVTNVYGDTWFLDRPDMNYKGIPAAVVPCLDQVRQGDPPMDVAAAKSRDAMAPASTSGWQTILDALIAPFKWLLKLLGGQS
jgi:hypothetical protein